MSVSTMWMRCNRLQLNTAKDRGRLGASSRRQHEIPQVPVRVGDDSVSPSTTVRDLVIYLDCDASTIKSHVTKTVANCFAALRQIHSVRRSVTRLVLLSLVSALVLSRLDYDSATLACLPTCLLNAAARLVHSARKHDHVTPLLDELHWLQMRQRIDYKLAVLIFRCLYGQAPPYLTEGLQRVTEVDARRHLRSASTNAPQRVTRPSAIAPSQWPPRESGTRFR